MYKTLLISLLFVGLPLSSFATYSNIVVDTSRVSGVDYGDTSNPANAATSITIFGGSTGCDPATAVGGICSGDGYLGSCMTGRSGTATCNSCTGMTTVAAASTYFRCAQRNVYPTLQFRITFTVDSVPTGVTTVKARWGEASSQADLVISNTPIVAVSTPITVEIPWSEICKTAGNATCDNGTLFSGSMYVGVTNDALSTANSIKMNVKFHHLSAEQTPDTTVTRCQNGSGASTVFCDFKVAPGDKKVYVKDLYRGATGTSDGTGIKWTGVRVFHAVCAPPCLAPAFDTIPVGAGAQYEDLTVQSKSEIETGLSDNKITSGFENEVDYMFNIATIDESSIINGFIDPANLTALYHTARPGEVIGLLDDKHCFVATAAYGSDMAPQVQMLREFRNKFLLNHAWGRSFVKLYYKLSPPMAQFISSHDALRAMVRTALWPMIAFAELTLHFGVALAILIFVIGFLVLMSVSKFLSRRLRKQRVA